MKFFIAETFEIHSIMQISRSAQSIWAQLSLMFIYKTFIAIVVVKFAVRQFVELFALRIEIASKKLCDRK